MDNMTKPVYKLTIGDMITAFILIIFSLFFIAGGLVQETGGEAQILVDNHLLMTINLKDDRSYDIQGKISVIRLSVENGELRVTETDCPLHLCMKQGSVSRRGEVIICLPNRFMAVIEGGSSPKIHGITG